VSYPKSNSHSLSIKSVAKYRSTTGVCSKGGLHRPRHPMTVAELTSTVKDAHYSVFFSKRRLRGLINNRGTYNVILTCFRITIVDVEKQYVLPSLIVSVAFVIQHAVRMCCSTVRSESRCAIRLRYVDLVVSIEVAAVVCFCLTVFSC
jgi:hypothetical protein